MAIGISFRMVNIWHKDSRIERFTLRNVAGSGFGSFLDANFEHGDSLDYVTYQMVVETG